MSALPYPNPFKARKAVLQGWLNYYSSLSGLPVVDGYTLAAALERAGQRGDQTGARALLKAELEGEEYSEEAEVVRAAAIRAGRLEECATRVQYSIFEGDLSEVMWETIWIDLCRINRRRGGRASAFADL